MKSHIEKVPQRPGVSWRYTKIVENTKVVSWHRHEEFEVAIHQNFLGTCYIGHHSSDIYHNHMVLLGPHIPHAYYSSKASNEEGCITHVFWFKKDWVMHLIDSAEELKPLKSLLDKAEQGICFSENTVQKILALLDTVLNQGPFEQLATLIKVFGVMVDEKNLQVLLSSGYKSNHLKSVDNEKLRQIEDFFQNNFGNQISQSDLAEHLYMSESSVRRFFQKHYKENFSQHLKKIRLNIACDLLMNTSLPVNIIMERVGYVNQANFNRQFKSYKKVTPVNYRKKLNRITS